MSLKKRDQGRARKSWIEVGTSLQALAMCGMMIMMTNSFIIVKLMYKGLYSTWSETTCDFD